MIPAAGRGSRLLPPGSKLPKSLIDVGGRPLMLRLLERLPSDVSDICLVVDDLEGPIRERVGAEQLGTRIHYVTQPEPLGVGDAVLRTAGLVRDAFLVVMGDVYFDRSLDSLTDAWERSGAEGAVLVEPVSGSPEGPIGLVTVRGDAVVGIWKSDDAKGARLRVCGAAILPEEAFKARRFLRGSVARELELEDVITWSMRERGDRFVAVRYGGWRQNINGPDDLTLVVRRMEADC